MLNLIDFYFSFDCAFDLYLYIYIKYLTKMTCVQHYDHEESLSINTWKLFVSPQSLTTEDVDRLVHRWDGASGVWRFLMINERKKRLKVNHSVLCCKNIVGSMLPRMVWRPFWTHFPCPDNFQQCSVLFPWRWHFSLPFWQQIQACLFERMFASLDRTVQQYEATRNRHTNLCPHWSARGEKTVE